MKNSAVNLLKSLSVCEHISETTGPIVTKFFVQIPGPWLGPPVGSVALRYVLSVYG